MIYLSYDKIITRIKFKEILIIYKIFIKQSAIINNNKK